MSMLRVALLQMASHGPDQEVNLAKGEVFCRQAHQMGADIALFPEMWNIGYTGYGQEVDEDAASNLWRARRASGLLASQISSWRCARSASCGRRRRSAGTAPM